MIFSNLTWEPVNTPADPRRPMYVDDISLLPEQDRHLFQPRPYTSRVNIKGWCVYGYLREEDDEYGPKGSLRYVGEGNAKRPASVDHSVRVPAKQFIVIFVDNITKAEAVIGEEILIDFYDRITTTEGILENIMPGGRGLPNRKKLKKLPCRYCGNLFTVVPGGLNKHESTCELNPNRIIIVLTKGYCQYCGEEFGHLRNHEKTCDKNPNKEPAPNTAIPRKRKNCRFCGEESGNVVAHERSCAKKTQIAQIITIKDARMPPQRSVSSARNYTQKRQSQAI